MIEQRKIMNQNEHSRIEGERDQYR